MKIRIKFRKWGAMKFIGHLDMMRYFQKAMRRANVDICYSEGFSPHQIMSFAAPLGVGITSDGEYFDIEVHSSLPSREAIARLNAVMVDGVEITGYVQLPDHAKTAMSLVAAADYNLRYESPCTPEEWRQIIKDEFTDKAEFSILKTTKKGQREVDLKPLVYAFEVLKENGNNQFFLRVSTGSNENLKPELVLSSLCEKCGLVYVPEAIQVHRLEVYGREETSGELVSLLAMGEEI